MPGYEWIEHKGVRMLSIDIAAQDHAELENIIEQLKPVIAAEPKGSVKCLANTAGGRFTSATTKALREFTEYNKPFIKMTAIIGVQGLQLTLYNAILSLTGRKNLIMKKSREEALDFLALF